MSGYQVPLGWRRSRSIYGWWTTWKLHWSYHHSWNKTRPELIGMGLAWRLPTGWCRSGEYRSSRFLWRLVWRRQTSRDDWETLMPARQRRQRCRCVLLTRACFTIQKHQSRHSAEQGIEASEQLEEIFNAVPVMFCGLTQRGIALAEAQ